MNIELFYNTIGFVMFFRWFLYRYGCHAVLVRWVYLFIYLLEKNRYWRMHDWQASYKPGQVWPILTWILTSSVGGSLRRHHVIMSRSHIRGHFELLICKVSFLGLWKILCTINSNLTLIALLRIELSLTISSNLRL